MPGYFYSDFEVFTLQDILVLRVSYRYGVGIAICYWHIGGVTLTIMAILVVWYVPVRLEPIQALLRIPVVRQLAATAAVLLSSATLTTVAVWVVLCCCNKKRRKLFNIARNRRTLDEACQSVCK